MAIDAFDLLPLPLPYKQKREDPDSSGVFSFLCLLIDDDCASSIVLD